MVERPLRVLFLAADPSDQSRLRLSEEHREIDEKIRLSGGHVELVEWLSVRATDLQDALLRWKPNIVHFSGHGSDCELVFEGRNGESFPVGREALADLFRILRGDVRLVVMNACFSMPQAKAITEVIDFAIGMDKAVGDAAAIAFASAFYRALGFAESVLNAFELGCNALKILNIPEDYIPKLLVRQGVDASNVFLIHKDENAKKSDVSSIKQSQSNEEPARKLRIFYSYAHEDESLRERLQTHLAVLRRQGLISEWHDRDITAGEEWRGTIDDNLNAADVVLLLISASFLASDYCYDIELNRALERHHAGEALVIPIILRECDWKTAGFGELQALPKAGKPVTTWGNRDQAFTDIARGIRSAIMKLRGRST